eukprot:3358786-Alexandrium_andersonii.AAC.1
MQKSGVLCTTKELHAELKDKLKEMDLPIVGVAKDLGVDMAAQRRRIVPKQAARVKEAVRRMLR